MKWNELRKIAEQHGWMLAKTDSNMKTTAVIEKGKDGTFGIFTPDIEHVIIGEGSTVAEAKEDFENSVEEILAYYKEECKELPEELRDIEFEYRYDIASVFNFFDFINVSKFARWAGSMPGFCVNINHATPIYQKRKYIK